MGVGSWVLIGVGVLLVGVTAFDLVQRRHAVLRNFPIIGHFRYLLESVGPELRQYIVTSNEEERPFSRDQRRWVYATAKLENSAFGFGSDNDIERARGYLIIRHAPFPVAGPPHGTFEPVPCAKVLGAARGRRHAFRPQSIVNVSGMSFGSLSGPAVRALNAGARIAGCLQSTGEGGLSEHHRQGGDLVFQVGTGYFGCRDEHGRFDLGRLLETIDGAPVRALEIKLSQGAKPGLGGFLPGAKVSAEIAAIRGIPQGRDCASPPGHSAFSDVDSMLDFVETLADATGLPVGIKSAVGESAFWVDLAQRMEATGRGVDFVVIDGGEGGTGAAPLAFADHVALPFRLAVATAYRPFAERGLHERVVFVGSGKLGFPESALLAMALGCDMVNVAREAMMAIGCIQAQRCHTGHCPTGVATQSRWLQRGLDPTDKAVRLANYVAGLRAEVLALSRACGVAHPSLVPLDRFAFVDEMRTATAAPDVFGYPSDWGLPGHADQRAIVELMAVAGGPAGGR